MSKITDGENLLVRAGRGPWITAVIFLALFWVAWLPLGSEIVLKALDIIMIPVCVAVVMTYGPDVVRGLKTRPGPVTAIRMGILLAWASTGVDRLWRLLWRELDYPTFMATHWFPAILLYFMVVAGSLHAVALGVDMQRTPAAEAAKRLTIRAVVIGVVLSIIVLTFDWFDGYSKKALFRFLHWTSDSDY